MPRCFSGVQLEAPTRQIAENPAAGGGVAVMGAISRLGLKRFFFGNTAEVVLDLLNCDMLLVKPPGFARVPKRIRGVRFAAAPYFPGM